MPLPSNEELLTLVNHFFPPMDRREVTIYDLEPVEGRWGSWKRGRSSLMRLPLRETIRPNFQYSAPMDGGGSFKRKEFEDAAKRLDLYTHTFRFKAMRKAHTKGVYEPLDLYNMLQDIPKTTETMHLWNTLLPSSGIWSLSAWSEFIDHGNNFGLRAISDLPQPLGQILAMKPERLLTPKVHKITTHKQILSRYPDYDTCVLVTKELTCLRRSDGVLLTISGDHSKLLGSLPPSTHRPEIPKDLSANIHVELLVLEIITMIQGQFEHGTELDDAYVQIVQELPAANLKLQREGRLRKHESVALVKDFVTCMNEISQILSIAKQSSDSIRSLEIGFPNLDIPPHEPSSNVIQRNLFDSSDKIQKMLNTVNGQLGKLPDLLGDLKTSLDVNEMALMAESNNQAILVFTIVTVVFLPLSFFTSYFGMNIKGIADTEKSERYFWTVCGSTTVSIVILTLLFGFRRQLYDAIWTNRLYSRPSNNALSDFRWS
ncbi:MAG: hypothetical protein Q9167_002966 [Letrouitia subvulpina]